MEKNFKRSSNCNYLENALCGEEIVDRSSTERKPSKVVVYIEDPQNVVCGEKTFEWSSVDRRPFAGLHFQTALYSSSIFRRPSLSLLCPEELLLF